MKMGVDQARNDGASQEIDHARLRTGKLSDVRRASNSEDFAVANSESLLNRGALVNSQDLSIHEDDIGGLGPGRSRQDESNSHKRDQRSHSHQLLRRSQERAQLRIHLVRHVLLQVVAAGQTLAGHFRGALLPEAKSTTRFALWLGLKLSETAHCRARRQCGCVPK